MDNASLSGARRALSEHGLRPKKGFGQNFLVDKNILNKIADAAELDPESIAFEIGCGLGALTAALATRAGRVVGMELDTALKPILTEAFQTDPHVQIVYGDTLQLEWNRDVLGPLGLAGQTVTICANLPYYITSPIIFRILDYGKQVRHAVLMMQKEVADRLAAKPGTKDYGLLTVMVAYRADVAPVTRVSRNCFLPVPEVDSSVIKLTPLPAPRISVESEALFMRLVREAFQKRRKTMQNVLNSAGWLRPGAACVLGPLGIDPMRRGETLSLEEFGRIADALCAYGRDTDVADQPDRRSTDPGTGC